jgi:hypothetical protein
MTKRVQSAECRVQIYCENAEPLLRQSHQSAICTLQSAIS